MSASARPPLRSDLPMDPPAPRPDRRLVARRIIQMVWAGLLFGIDFAVACATGLARNRSQVALHALGTSLRRACTRLGATFIKIGQIASTRADLLPEPITMELRHLQDRVPAFPMAEVERLIALELGRPIAQVYRRFDDVPVAAASVAQVHRAELSDGTVVAVKVRRPDIQEKVQLDRAILLFLAHGLERVVPTLRLISIPEAVATFCDAVEQQLSMRNEAAHGRRFGEMFADDPDIHFPRVHAEASSDGILTMEFIEGLHESELEGSGVDIERVVNAGMRAVSRMIFDYGFVHADLHPGNLLFVPPGRLVMLDLGLVGEISDIDRITTVRLFFALATGDGRTCARLFYENAPHTACADYQAYENEVVAMIDDIVGQGLMNLQITLEIGRIFDILRRHRIQARAHMTMVNLALMTAEGLGKRLAPDFNLTREALPYLQEAMDAGRRQGRIPGTPPSR